MHGIERAGDHGARIGEDLLEGLAGDEVAEERTVGADRQIPAGRSVDARRRLEDAQRLRHGEIAAAHFGREEQAEEARLVNASATAGGSWAVRSACSAWAWMRRKLPGALDVDGGPVGNGIGHGSPETPVLTTAREGATATDSRAALERPMRRRLDAGTTRAANACAAENSRASCRQAPSAGR